MLTILTMLSLVIIFVWLYSLTFFSKQSFIKDIPEKNCPKCGLPKLEVTSSTIRSFEYKCKNCGFEHRTLKEGQTNTLKK